MNEKKYDVYYDNDELYPLADELTSCFSKFLEDKGIWFFNEDSDEFQMKNRHAIYGEDFRTLQEMVQTVLDKRRIGVIEYVRTNKETNGSNRR